MTPATERRDARDRLGRVASLETAIERLIREFEEHDFERLRVLGVELSRDHDSEDAPVVELLVETECGRPVDPRTGSVDWTADLREGET